MSTPTDIIECPKCKNAMRRLIVEDSYIDRCPHCFGIWADGKERIKLVAHKKLANMIDIGPEEVGKQYDKITDIDCPRCGDRMQHLQHPDQKHIGFEECRRCQGASSTLARCVIWPPSPSVKPCA